MTGAVLVIGGGLAGLAAAVAVAEAGAAVLVWSKVHPLASHSVAATGGINAAIGPDDSWDRHAADTLRAADGLADRDAVDTVCQGAAEEVQRLERFGVPFNRDADGRLGTKAISGSSAARTVFAGEQTGRAMLQALWQRALALGVTIVEPVFLLELVTDGGTCTGAIGLDLARGELIAAAGSVVIASGGLGRLYAPSTNAAINSGDGTAAALAAGAALRDMEMTQFYPTCFVPSGACVTEEARVQGAVIVDDRGERFLIRDDVPGLEMANRDVLSRAIFAEQQAGRRIFLDCRPVEPEVLRGRLRGFMGLSAGLTGIDVATLKLPITPAFHYQMGGIATDIAGRSSLSGLYACGECACVSVHGGNRIGANSLLETLVMGRNAGRSAARDAVASSVGSELASRAAAVETAITELRARSGAGIQVARIHERLGRLMSESVGVIREAGALASAAGELDTLAAELATLGTGDSRLAWNQALRRYLELANLIELGRAVTASAMARHESRGAHFRRDAATRDARPRHTEVVRKHDKLCVRHPAVRGAS